MSTLALSEIQLTHLVTHRVGNKTREEGCILSSKGSRIKKEALSHLVEYFLSPFKAEAFYTLSHPEEKELNEVFQVAKQIFDSTEGFAKQSQTLAQVLYDCSDHPKIATGQFHVARMTGAILDGESVEVLGLFKTETSLPFLKLNPLEDCYEIATEEGVDIKGLDKGCIIFNTEAEKGFKVLVHNGTRSTEARFWNDSFLQLKESEDEYHQTKEFMHITKEFLTKQLAEEFEVTKTDQIDLLNRSVEYFKGRQEFDKEDFTQTVFQDKEVISSFDTFDKGYRQSHHLAASSSFEISPEAVKKQSRVFKSVLKLDKNFHVYIHGDKNLIERGEDPDGRKFYKIFFEKEE